MNRPIDIFPGDMLAFAAVVRAGSFTRAAAEVGASKQTLSERVARLEAALHVRLLERTTRRLRPTEAGAVYAERCAAIAAQIADANAIVQERQRKPTGVLRVASPTLYGRRFLAPVIADYLSRYPQMQVDVVLTDRPVDPVADSVDLAIQIGRLPNSSARVRRIGDGFVYFVASPSYVARYGTPDVADLSAARCIGLRATESWRVADTAVSVRPSVVINDLETQYLLACAGVGIARLPGLVCADALRDGRLLRLFPTAEASVRPVSVVLPSKAFTPAKVSRFVERLLAMIPPMTPVF